jgi:hypothetical protein
MSSRKIKVSKQLKEFLRFYNESVTAYNYCTNRLEECDKLTQDLLHKLELDKLTTVDKNKIATQLKYCRQDRRYYKDRVEELKPFMTLFNGDDHSTIHNKFINKLQNALGQTRKVEEYHNNRTYNPRILKDEWGNI